MSRGPAYVQRINDDLAEEIVYTNNTLHANVGGTTSTAVLRFNAAGTYVGPTGGITDATTAAEGTIFSIFEPGMYSAELTVSQVGAVDNFWGLSIGLASPITLMTYVAGALAVTQLNSDAAETLSSVITLLFPVSQLRARQAGGLQLRAMGAAAAGGVAVPGAVLGNFAIRITKVGSLAT